MNSPRATYHFVSPEKEVNAGIWSLFAGATLFLSLRIFCKLRRSGLWWDDYILIAAWSVLLATDILISYEFATGYVVKTWDDRMLILVSISSCLTTAGQAWSKTAFAVTLMRMTNRWQKIFLWCIIVILNIILVLKVFVDWAKYCGKKGDQNYWRMQGFCIDYQPVQNIKTAGNIFNILADFLLALMPWLLVWKLKIGKKEKIALCVTMSVGILIAVVSAVRTAWMQDPANSEYNDLYFWHQGLSMVWYSSEVAGTIMAQCVPVLRPLIQDAHTSISTARSARSTKRRTVTVNDLPRQPEREPEKMPETNTNKSETGTGTGTENDDDDDDRVIFTDGEGFGSEDNIMLQEYHTHETHPDHHPDYGIGEAC